MIYPKFGGSRRKVHTTLCGGCGVAAYCGEACRREHWAQGHAARCGLRGWTDRLLQVWGEGWKYGIL